MAKNGNGTKVTVAVLGERLDNLKESLFNKETGSLPRLELKFDNHLKHHEKKESKTGDRVFKIITLILQLIISVGILTLLKFLIFDVKIQQVIK